MKHQKQGLDECQLVVIAMLSNTPLDEVRTLACGLAGVKDWTEATRDLTNTEPFWRTVDELCELYGVPTAPQFRISGLSFVIGETVLGEDPTESKLAQDLLADGLYGRGMLGMMGPYTTSSHVVAFEDGVVFDGNEEGPVVLKDWLRKWVGIVGWRWFKISRERR